MLEKQKYLKKNIYCWINGNVIKKRNVGKKMKCWRNRNV